MDAEAVKLGTSSSVHAHLWTRDIHHSRGYFIVVHGLGDHGGRYRGFAKSLLRRNFGVLAIDLPGHGKSEGRRGRAPSYRGFLRTIADARRFLVERFGKTQHVLLGHSMGGNLALNYTLRHDEFDPPWMPKPDELVLVAPMLMPPQVVDRTRLFAAWLTGHLFGWIRLSRDVGLDQLTADPTAVERIQTDPLQHSQVSLYLATQLLAQGRYALDHAHEVDTRTLVLLGDRDELIDRAACHHLGYRMPSAEVVSCPNGRHDLLHDVDADTVVDHIFDFIGRSQRMALPKAA